MPQGRYAKRASSLVACAILTMTVAPAVGVEKAQQTARVSGRLSAFDGRMLLTGAVTIVSADDAAPPIPSDEVTILPDGRFSFGGVPPGRYQIRARGETETNGQTLFASFGLTVQDRDISNIEMTLRPGAALSGEIVIERKHATRRPTLTALTVRAPLVDGSGFGDALTGRVARDGSFNIRGLIIGTHHVMLEGLPDSWVLKSVVANSRDLTDQPFDVDAGQQLRNVRLTISDAVSELSGRVRDAEDRPAGGADVLVFSVSPQFWIPGGTRVRLVRAGPEGRFLIRGLPPGGYLALATTAFDERKIARPRKHLEQLRELATPFSITSDEAQAALDLRVTRAGAVP